MHVQGFEPQRLPCKDSSPPTGTYVHECWIRESNPARAPYESTVVARRPNQQRERAKGIEPSPSAWKAVMLPLNTTLAQWTRADSNRRPTRLPRGALRAVETLHGPIQGGEESNPLLQVLEACVDPADVRLPPYRLSVPHWS